MVPDLLFFSLIVSYLLRHACLEKQIPLSEVQKFLEHMVMFESPLLPSVRAMHYIPLPLDDLPVLCSACLTDSTFL